VADAIALAGLLPLDCDCVAGIPRSGMLPASVIATHLHLPLYELTESGRLNRLGHGSRGRAMGFGEETRNGDGRLVVVDDTVYSGYAMRTARQNVERLRRRAVFAAVYIRPEITTAVDLFGRMLSSPHLLEWNFANNGPFVGLAVNPIYKGGMAIDLDGVVVHDADSGGPVGTPYLTPRTHPCKLIVTGRPERHRAETEALLRRVRARWERLEMLPDHLPQTIESIAQHKARHFVASGCGFFVESCPVQAELIFRMTGRPTVCPRTGQVWAAASG
jgi:orotate phosphoribosyltransferase